MLLLLISMIIHTPNGTNTTIERTWAASRQGALERKCHQWCPIIGIPPNGFPLDVHWISTILVEVHCGGIQSFTFGIPPFFQGTLSGLEFYTCVRFWFSWLSNTCIYSLCPYKCIPSVYLHSPDKKSQHLHECIILGPCAECFPFFLILHTVTKGGIKWQ